MSEKAPVDPESARAGLRRWRVLFLATTQIGIILLSYFSLLNTRGAFLSWGAAMLAAMISLATTITLRLRLKRAGSKYDTMLRAIDKSKPHTPIRAATTTAIDAVARRTHGNRTTASVVFAAALLLVLLLNLRWNHLAPNALVILLVTAIVVLNASTLALDYRISHGLFGTNESEAREIVRFVLTNAVDNDFSGGLGVRDLDLSASTETDLAAVWAGVPAYE